MESTIPLVIEDTGDGTMPFFDTLLADYFTVSHRPNNEREYEILKYRYGLSDRSIRTLDDIGIIYGISRERVRQIEQDIKNSLKRLVITGELVTRKHTIRLHPYFFKRLTCVLHGMETFQDVESEDTLVKYMRECFNVINLDVSAMRLLLELYGYSRIVLSTRHLQYAWAKHGTDPEQLQAAMSSSYTYLRKVAIARHIDDILLSVNRNRRRNRLSRETVERSLALSPHIEVVEDNSYQVKYEDLRSITDKIYRMLHTHGEPMHIREIARRANSEAFKHGKPLRMNAHNVGSRLSGDDRFEAIGRSGEWALDEWNVETDSVLTVMRDALHASGEPLSPEQVFSFVRMRRPVAKAAITSYLGTHSDFVRVATNRFALASWGMQSVSSHKPSRRARKLSKAKLAEYIESIFIELDVSEMYISELAEAVAELDEVLNKQAIYGSVMKSPAVTIEVRREGKVNRRIAVFNPTYKSLLTKADILTRDIPMGQLIKKTVRELLRLAPDQSMRLSDLRDSVSAQISCPPSSVYGAIREMEDVAKRNSDRYRGDVCMLTETSEDYSEYIEQIVSMQIREEIRRAIRMLTIDTIDVALFQLGKMFENILRQYILAVEANGEFPVSNKDKGTLFNMIKWAEASGIIVDASALNYLRLERNDRGHGDIPDEDERKAMLATSPQIVKFYLEYMVLILGRIDNLSH